MKITVLVNYSESIISFRGELLHEFVTAGHEVIVCAPGDHGDVSDRLKKMGVTYRSIKLDRTGTNLFCDLAAFIKLIWMFLELRPDVVICYTIKPVIYGSMAARLTGVTHVFSIITGLGYVFIGDSWKQKLLRPIVCLMYRLAFACNDIFFFLNNDDKTTFATYGIINKSDKCVRVDGEGIDISKYPYTVIDEECIDDRVMDINSHSVKQPALKMTSFLLIARLIRDKGIIEYVEAAKILTSKYSNIKFKLVGPLDSNPTSISKIQIKDWEASGIIEYLGETKNVRPFIQKSSVYVLPSYREGLPRTVLEAMAMGRPIITTDAPGCRETVIDNDNGFLVPVKSAEALAFAMEKFILNPDLIEKMGKRSREIVEVKFDVIKVNAAIRRHMGL